ncbi:hypothetical protein DF057_35860 [Burkholderia cepacia]|nr:hypothetical protein DF057_35860 [Burkholderia cepacia]
MRLEAWRSRLTARGSRLAARGSRLAARGSRAGWCDGTDEGGTARRCRIDSPSSFMTTGNPDRRRMQRPRRDRYPCRPRQHRNARWIRRAIRWGRARAGFTSSAIADTPPTPLVATRTQRNASRQTDRACSHRAPPCASRRPHAQASACTARDAVAHRRTRTAHHIPYCAAIRRRKCSVPATILSSTASSAQNRSRTS